MQWSRKIAVVLGLWLGSLVVPSAGHAAPSKGGEAPETGKGTSSTRVPGLAIWVEPTVPEGERIGGWVEERGAEVLRQHQLEPQDLVRVAVRGTPYDYQIHIALVRNKHLLPDQPGVIVCECGSDEMLGRVGEAIDAGARRLMEAAEAERKMAEESAGAEAPVTTDDGKRRRKLGALGYAGIGVGVVGVGLVAAGIPLALRPDELRGEPPMLSSYSTRPPGLGLAIGGGVALAAGITLVVVDVVRHRKPRVAVVPTAWRGLAGMTIVGRF